MAVLSVRPLRRSDRQISRTLPGAICRLVRAQPAARFRHRLSLAHLRIERAAVGQGRARRAGAQRGDGRTCGAGAAAKTTSAAPAATVGPAALFLVPVLETGRTRANRCSFATSARDAQAGTIMLKQDDRARAEDL